MTFTKAYTRQHDEAMADAQAFAEEAAESAASLLGFAQTIGRAVADTPVTGTASGTPAYVFATPLASAAVTTRLRVYALATGAVRITSWSKAGNDFTLVGETVVAIPATGLNDIDITGKLSVAAGLHIGVQGEGIIAATVAAGDSGGYFESAGSFSGTTFTDAAAQTGIRLQIGVDFGYLPAEHYVERRLQELLDASRAGFTIGKTGTPTTGATGANRVYVIPKAAPRAGILHRLRFFALGDGTVKVRTFSKAGDEFTQTGEVSFAVTTGLNELVAEEALIVEAGEYVGLYTTAGILPAVSASPEAERWWIGYYDNALAGGGDLATFTDAAPAYVTALQVGFDFLDYDEDAREEFVIRMTAPTSGGAGDEPDWSATEPTGHVLCWLIGQSNTPGRSTIKSSLMFMAGHAYKYVRSSTDLQNLADPTGNDATALASGGKGSMGPAIAHTLRQLSRGRLGAIIVNSGEGGTSLLTNWASGGSAWTQAVTDLGNARTDALAKGLRIAGCCVVMCQGETDAINGVSEAAYEAAFIDLKTRVDAQIGSKVPFFIVRIGTLNTGDSAGYQAIRAAQNDLTESQAGVFMAHSAAVDFNGRGEMIDTYHFSLTALEEIGEAVGQTALAHAVGHRPLGYDG